MKHLLIIIFLSLVFISRVWAEPITMVAWNVEDFDFGGRHSDSGSDGAVIAAQLRDDFHNIDIFGLSEVHSESTMQTFALMASSDEEFSYKYVYGATGGTLHLGMLVNADRYEIVSSEELDFGLSSTGTRFPLAVHLKDKSSGLEFTAVVVHLARGNETNREIQAAGLAQWAATQTNSVFALGDFNFDYNIIDGTHNTGYIKLLENGYFEWLKPSTLIDTSWSGPPTADSFPNSMLDFIFVGGEAKKWLSQSFVYQRQGDFPDSGDTADHRPVFSYVTGGAQTALPEDYTTLLPRLDHSDSRINSLNAGSPLIKKYLFTAPLSSTSRGPASVFEKSLPDNILPEITLPKGKVTQGGLEGIDPKYRPLVDVLRDLSRNGSQGYFTPDANPDDFPPGLLPYIRQLQTLENLDGFDGR